MNTIETTPEDFRRDAIPRLAVACRFHAPRIACGRETVEAAVTATMRLAGGLGAEVLPPVLFGHLQEWIKSRIRQETACARARASVSREDHW